MCHLARQVPLPQQAGGGVPDEAGGLHLQQGAGIPTSVLFRQTFGFPVNLWWFGSVRLGVVLPDLAFSFAQ